MTVERSDFAHQPAHPTQLSDARGSLAGAAKAQTMALVKLEITFVSGGEDDCASLLYVPDGGGEPQHYADVWRGAQIAQESFVGHKWVLKGKTTGNDLMHIEAAPAPATQEYRIDVDGEDANFLRPGRHRGERPLREPARRTTAGATARSSHRGFRPLTRHLRPSSARVAYWAKDASC